MLEFIGASFNEQQEAADLVYHVFPYVDKVHVVDDGSTDGTVSILDSLWRSLNDQTAAEDRFTWHSMPEHTGLPESVKNEALQHVSDGSWVILLDFDERFAPGVLEEIRAWLRTVDSLDVTHVYFQQFEILQNQHTRTFQKSKLFRKESIHFSSGIHEDDRFDGKGIYKPEWVVYHRKDTSKQILREKEYLVTYKRLLDEGKIDQGRYEWLRNLHYFERG